MKVTNHFDKGLIPLGLYMFAVVAFTISLADVSQNDVFVKGGAFGDVKVASFIMDKHHVTVEEFHEFVGATGYVTEAEKFGSGGVFDFDEQRFVGVEGACYLFPFGKSKPKAASNHPVTQVSWNDAVAYAKWKGKRLPTKLEWEYAASSGTLSDATYSWGEGFTKDGTYKANFWQGSFPFNNTREDGYLTTSPVGAFGSNKLGLTDMGGNVWQWCSDSVEPSGVEKIIDPRERKLLKGGSYLCDPLVCHGFRIFGESNTTPETAMAHIGFRCVKDISPATD